MPRLASIQAHGANPFFRGWQESFTTRHRMTAETISQHEQGCDDAERAGGDPCEKSHP